MYSVFNQEEGRTYLIGLLNWILCSMYKFFSDKQANEQHKTTAHSVLDNLLNKTTHTAYFNKLPFGRKQKFMTNQYYTWLY